MYTSITHIKKRSGDVVTFDPAKIEQAIMKSYLEVRGQQDPVKIKTITEGVVGELDKLFQDRIPGVEDVQNIVEMRLMADSLFDVAKGYIIYRYQHTKIREAKKEEVQRKIEKEGIMVQKRDGTREAYSEAKVRASLEKILGQYAEQVDVDKVTAQLRREVHEDITTKEIARTLIMVLRSYIEKDAAYSFVAARALLNEIYKEVVGFEIIDFSKLEEQLREAFVRTVQHSVSIGRLDPRVLLFDLTKMAKELSMARDGILNYLSVQTLTDRYLVKEPESKRLLETPQMFWMRIAMGVALNEKDREARAIEFYNVISTLHFVPSSPTLFHAGTVHPQLSSCYLTTVEDDLDHIFKCLGDNAQLSKWAGGVANDWNNLRGTGAIIKRTGVESQGVIPFLKIANDTTVAINRSGRRRGATCAYLETWHYDIESFLELRKNTGDERRRTHDMNIANWIPDLFMKRVKEDGMWSLFSPDETPELHHIFGKQFDKRYERYEQMGKDGQLRLFRQMRARDLWRKMLTMLFETGHPWVTFKDPSNIRSPQDHVGVVHSSNLCTEITLNTSADETAVCNLGSVNLARHILNGKLDLQKLAYTVTVGMRMLDNVIDINFYPTKEAEASNLKHRPVGLGIMGFHDALYQMNIPFDSETMVDFADRSMEAVSYHAIMASANMAKERGTYASFRGSKWDRGIFPVDTIALLEAERGTNIPVPRTEHMDWAPVRQAVKEYGMRNSNCMAIAPTATISNISGAIPSIEPIYNNIYVKANISGDFIVVNSYLVEDLKRLGLWNDAMLDQLKFHDGKLADIPGIPQEIKDKYKQVFEIDAKWLIRAAAYRGKWIDQSQSLNIFYAGKSGKEINDIYLYAWEMGLKTTYYLRTLAVSQVEKSTVDTAAHGNTHLRNQAATSAQVSSEAVQTEPVMASTPAPVAAPEPVMAAVRTPEAERAVEIKAEPVTPASGVLAVAAVGAFKVCRLDDPSCEACQ
ncbi:MAG: ribonucleoside-diphosphate reductase subunit alpha [Candidatus Doudnabacteria bacterium]|nr:ribonucleoside-diphosphate reductase subunit alpha [Candidatus Doudnabacteria bacterium]